MHKTSVLRMEETFMAEACGMIKKLLGVILIIPLIFCSCQISPSAYFNRQEFQVKTCLDLTKPEISLKYPEYATLWNDLLVIKAYPESAKYFFHESKITRAIDISEDPPTIKWTLNLDQEVRWFHSITQGIMFGITYQPWQLLALDIENGTILWQHALKGTRFSNETELRYLNTFYTNVQKTSSFSFYTSEQCFYYMDQEGTIVALNLKHGTKEWEYASSETEASLLIVEENSVYFSTYDSNHQQYVYALDAENGTLLWRHQITGNAISDPIPDHINPDKWSLFIPLIASKQLIMLDLSTSLPLALDARTGKKLWSASLEHAPSPAKNLLLFRSYKTIQAFDWSNGKMLWDYPHDENYILKNDFTHDIDQNNFYFVHGKNLIALGLKDGKERWTHNLWNVNEIDPDPDNLKLFFMGTSKKFLHTYSDFGLLSFNKHDGTLSWQLPLEDPEMKGKVGLAYKSPLGVVMEQYPLDGPVPAKHFLPFFPREGDLLVISDARIIRITNLP
jgi:outer membrane protein assembly factor BamB